MVQDITIVHGMAGIIIHDLIRGDSICTTAHGPDGDSASISTLAGLISASVITARGPIMAAGGGRLFIVLLTAGRLTAEGIMVAIMAGTMGAATL
jgi:hypothetical protein